MINQLMPDGAIDVVSAIAKRCLCRADAEHDPIGFDVTNVIKHQSTNRHGPQVHQRRWLFDIGQLCVLGMKRQRNEDLESPRLVLQFAQANQMVDTMISLFDVPI